MLGERPPNGLEGGENEEKKEEVIEKKEVRRRRRRLLHNTRMCYFVSVEHSPRAVEMTGVDQSVDLQLYAPVGPGVQRVPARVRAGQRGRFDLAERGVRTGQKRVRFYRYVAHCNNVDGRNTAFKIFQEMIFILVIFNNRRIQRVLFWGVSLVAVLRAGSVRGGR